MRSKLRLEVLVRNFRAEEKAAENLMTIERTHTPASRLGGCFIDQFRQPTFSKRLVLANVNAASCPRGENEKAARSIQHSALVFRRRKALNTVSSRPSSINPQARRKVSGASAIAGSDAARSRVASG